MKRLTVQLMTAALTFGIGLAASTIYKFAQIRTPDGVVSAGKKELSVAMFDHDSEGDGPLRVTQTPGEYHARKITIENVGAKPIARYTIGFDGSRLKRPLFSTTTQKEEEGNDLAPGAFDTQWIHARPDEEVRAWVDYVEFTDGTTWGRNESGEAANE